MAASVVLPAISTPPAKSAPAARDDGPGGLTADEARRRLAKFGLTAIPDTTMHPLRRALNKF
jgi:hypothetical protein